MNTTNNRKLMDLRRKLRNRENDIELTLESNLNGCIFYKDDNLEFELKNKGNITFITLAEAKKIDRAFFEKRWINIIDVYTEDTDLILSLEDIYYYLQIDKYYNFINDTVYLFNENDYKEMLTNLDTVGLERFLTKLDNTTKREITETVINLYKTNELTDYKKIQVIEECIPDLYFDDIK